MRACARDDALRLLGAIDAQQRARGCVGTTVFAFDVAEMVGLEPCTERYEEAVWYLLWEGALTVNVCVSLELVARLPFGMAAYKLKPEATSMLEQD